MIPVKGHAARRGASWSCSRSPRSPRRLRPRRPAERKPTRRSGPAERKAREASDDEIARLAQELAATREYLQSVIEQQEAANEELQSANEEVQSANEELQSINEELETSKEEIQSSNEELATVNDELNNRNLELSRLNNDLINLLGSVQMAIVMLGPDLRDPPLHADGREAVQPDPRRHRPADQRPQAQHRRSPIWSRCWPR